MDCDFFLKLKLFGDLTEDELRSVLEWRNSEKVREEMIDNSIISWERHLAFIENLKKDSSKKYYLVCSYIPIGVIYLNSIIGNEAELGLYKNPNLNRNGIGSILLEQILLLSKRLGIKKLRLTVKKKNNSAFYLYRKFKFIVVREDLDFFYMERDCE